MRDLLRGVQSLTAYGLIDDCALQGLQLTSIMLLGAGVRGRHVYEMKTSTWPLVMVYAGQLEISPSPVHSWTQEGQSGLKLPNFTRWPELLACKDGETALPEAEQNASTRPLPQGNRSGVHYSAISRRNCCVFFRGRRINDVRARIGLQVPPRLSEPRGRSSPWDQRRSASDPSEPPRSNHFVIPSQL